MNNVNQASIIIRHLDASLNRMKKFDRLSFELFTVIENIDADTYDGETLILNMANKMGFKYSYSDLNNYDMHWYRLGKRQ